MDRIVNILIVLIFTLGVGYTTKTIIFQIKKTTLTRVKKGLSKSEPFAQKLTGKKLPF